MQRFEARLTLVENEQETLREHYDRLYSLNVNAIGDIRKELEDVKQLVLDQRLAPFPRPIEIRELDPKDEETPVFSWHQELRRKQITLPKASLSAVLLVVLTELLRLVAEGHIAFSFH